MMSLKNDRYLGAALERYGEYSEGEVELWRQLIRPEWVIADVGANIGCHTVAFARLASRGRVVAFEPLQYAYHLLCGNLALNALTHVTALNVAVGRAPGSLYVPGLDYTVEENYGGLALGKYEQGRRTSVVRLDDTLPIVHFIKADVEGMEQQVLEGAQRLITECRPVLYLENNPESVTEGRMTLGTKAEALIDYVHMLNYDLWWHKPPLYNPANYRHCTVDMEPGVVSFNMLGLPNELKATIGTLEKIERAAIQEPCRAGPS